MTISAVNDPPVSGPDSQSIDEDLQLVFDAVTLIGNDLPGPATATDEAAQLLSVVAVSSTSANGAAVSLTSGAISYTPPLDFFGTDTFTYTVRDNGSPTASSTGIVTVTVREVNDAPIPVSDSRETPEDTRHVFNAALLVQNDDAGPSNESTQLLSVTGVSPVSDNQGTVTLISGVITYTPPANYNGETSLPIRWPTVVRRHRRHRHGHHERDGGQRRAFRRGRFSHDRGRYLVDDIRDRLAQ